MRTGARVVWTAIIVAGLLGAGALTGLAADLVARDRAFTIDRFDRDVVVAADARLEVVETITVTFSESRRGIFRDLPSGGPAGDVSYTVWGVDRGEGSEPWEWTTLSIPDGVRVRVGNPDVHLSPGRYIYRFRYDIDGLVFVPDDRPDVAEVRLDVPGFSWPTDVAETHLRIAAPGGILAARCVAGPVGTTRPCDPPVAVEGRQATARFNHFAPGRAATVAIDLPAAAITGSLPTTSIRSLGSRNLAGPLDIDPPAAGLWLALVLAIPFVAFESVKSVLVYRDEATDPHLHGRVQPTAVFAPPFEHRPLEVGGLLLRRDQQSLLIGTLIDLDQRGLVHTSTEGDGDEPTLVVRPGPPGSHPDALEADLLSTLLPNGTPARFDGEYDPDVAKRASAATALLHRRAYDVFRRHGYEHDRARWLRSPLIKGLAYLGLLGALALGTLVATAVLPLAFGAAAVVAGLVFVAWLVVRGIWRHHRLPLNSAGRDAVGKARAFREFLATVEADQLEWAADQPGIDHHHPAVSLLPYAVVLGLADSWYDRFGPLLRELAASAGAGAATGTTWWASSSGYQGVRTSSSGTTTSPSSSGGGGGGSGGGGGGGGSW